MIEWHDDYLTGVEEIDLQHRYFVRLINRIEARIATLAHDVRHRPLLNELVYYARFHFLSEENLMAEADYPALAEHKRLHAELIEKLNNEIHLLEGELVESGHIVAMLATWFSEHTLVEDRKYARHIARTDRPGTNR